jgi:hypothetical protein
MEEHRLKVFGNIKVRKIFGSKKEEITGVGRKLHGKELHDL